MTDETQVPKPAEAPAPTDIPVEVEAGDAAEKKLAALEQEKKELHERLLRTAADFDNFRKRTRKEVDDARHKAREDVLREILPVADNLERALAASEQQGSTAGIADGVKLVLRQFASALDRFDVKAFPSLGEAFDPARHEAISQVESADKPAGTVVNEMQKGYTLAGKLLRPAMVAVARPPLVTPTLPDEPNESPAAAEASEAVQAVASDGEEG